MKRLVLFFLTGLMFVWSCSTVRVTGRKQFNMVPNSQIFPASFAQYRQFLQEHPVSKNKAQQERIRNIGRRLVRATEMYYKSKGWQQDLQGYKWEFNLVADTVMNAFCMPGGKVVYFEGLLRVTQTDGEIAAVMGHEIAHALANHGAERMSQAYAQNIGAVLTMLATANAPEAERQKWLAIYGYGSTLGVILPFSRKQEAEADKIGQILMAVAGYDPYSAARVWEKMEKLSGPQPPEFLSTHPAHQTRLNNLRKWAPGAIKIAKSFGITPTVK